MGKVQSNNSTDAITNRPGSYQNEVVGNVPQEPEAPVTIPGINQAANAIKQGFNQIDTHVHNQSTPQPQIPSTDFVGGVPDVTPSTDISNFQFKVKDRTQVSTPDVVATATDYSDSNVIPIPSDSMYGTSAEFTPTFTRTPGEATGGSDTPDFVDTSYADEADVIGLPQDYSPDIPSAPGVDYSANLIGIPDNAVTDAAVINGQMVQAAPKQEEKKEDKKPIEPRPAQQDQPEQDKSQKKPARKRKISDAEIESTAAAIAYLVGTEDVVTSDILAGEARSINSVYEDVFNESPNESFDLVETVWLIANKSKLFKEVLEENNVSIANIPGVGAALIDGSANLTEQDVTEMAATGEDVEERTQSQAQEESTVANVEDQIRSIEEQYSEYEPEQPYGPDAPPVIPEGNMELREPQNAYEEYMTRPFAAENPLAGIIGEPRGTSTHEGAWWVRDDAPTPEPIKADTEGAWWARDNAPQPRQEVLEDTTPWWIAQRDRTKDYTQGVRNAEEITNDLRQRLINLDLSMYDILNIVFDNNGVPRPAFRKYEVDMQDFANYIAEENERLRPERRERYQQEREAAQEAKRIAEAPVLDAPTGEPTIPPANHELLDQRFPIPDDYYEPTRVVQRYIEAQKEQAEREAAQKIAEEFAEETAEETFECLDKLSELNRNPNLPATSCYVRDLRGNLVRLDQGKLKTFWDHYAYHCGMGFKQLSMIEDAEARREAQREFVANPHIRSRNKVQESVDQKIRAFRGEQQLWMSVLEIDDHGNTKLSDELATTVEDFGAMFGPEIYSVLPQIVRFASSLEIDRNGKLVGKDPADPVNEQRRLRDEHRKSVRAATKDKPYKEKTEPDGSYVSAEIVNTLLQQVMESQRKTGFPFSYINPGQKMFGVYRFPCPIIPNEIAAKFVAEGSVLHGDMTLLDFQAKAKQIWIEQVYPAVKRMATPSQRIVIEDMVRAVAQMDQIPASDFGIRDEVDSLEDVLNGTDQFCEDNGINTEEQLEINQKIRENALKAAERLERTKLNNKQRRAVKGMTPEAAADAIANMNTDMGGGEQALRTLLMANRAYGVIGSPQLVIGNILEGMQGNVAMHFSERLMGLNEEWSPTLLSRRLAENPEFLEAYRTICFLQSYNHDALPAFMLLHPNGPINMDEAIAFVKEHGQRTPAKDRKIAKLVDKVIQGDSKSSDLLNGEFILRKSEVNHFLNQIMIRQRISKDMGQSYFTPQQMEDFMSKDPVQFMANIMNSQWGPDSLVTARNMTFGRINPVVATIREFKEAHPGFDLALQMIGIKYPEFGVNVVGELIPFSHTAMLIAGRGYYAAKQKILGPDADISKSTLIPGFNEQYGLKLNMAMDLAFGATRLGTMLMFLTAIAACGGVDEPDEPELLYCWDEWKLGGPDGQPIRQAWWLSEFASWGLPMAVGLAALAQGASVDTFKGIVEDGIYDNCLDGMSPTLLIDNVYNWDYLWNEESAADLEYLEGGKPDTYQIVSANLMSMGLGAAGMIFPFSREINNFMTNPNWFTGQSSADPDPKRVYDENGEVKYTNYYDYRMRQVTSRSFGAALIMDTFNFLTGGKASGYQGSAMPDKSMIDSTQVSSFNKYKIDLETASNQERIDMCKNVEALFNKFNWDTQAMYENGIVIPYETRLLFKDYVYQGINARHNLQYAKQREPGWYTYNGLTFEENDYNKSLAWNEIKKQDREDKKKIDLVFSDKIPYAAGYYQKMRTGTQDIYTWQDGSPATPLDYINPITRGQITKKTVPYGNNQEVFGIASPVVDTGNYNFETGVGWAGDKTSYDTLNDLYSDDTVSLGVNTGRKVLDVILGEEQDSGKVGAPKTRPVVEANSNPTIGMRGYVFIQPENKDDSRNEELTNQTAGTYLDAYGDLGRYYEGGEEGIPDLMTTTPGEVSSAKSTPRKEEQKAPQINETRKLGAWVNPNKAPENEETPEGEETTEETGDNQYINPMNLTSSEGADITVDENGMLSIKYPGVLDTRKYAGDSGSYGNGYTRYSSGYRSYGSKSTYTPKIYATKGSSINSKNPATMYSKTPYEVSGDYLRPGFETKGSREAYKRADI